MGKRSRTTSANREGAAWEPAEWSSQIIKIPNISYLHAQLVEDKTSRVVKETMPFPVEFYDSIFMVMSYYIGDKQEGQDLQKPQDRTDRTKYIGVKVQRNTKLCFGNILGL